MNAKEFLNQIYNLDQIVKVNLRRLEDAKSLAEKITVSYGTESVSHSRNTSQLEDSVLRVVEAERAADEVIDRYVNAKQKVTNAIDKLNNPNYRELLDLRYLRFMKWEKIANEMGYTKRWIYRMHREALDEIGQLLQEECV